MKDDVRSLIEETLPQILRKLDAGKLQRELVTYDITIPKLRQHGDVSVNLAFGLSKQLKKNPMVVAEEAAQALTAQKEADLRWKAKIKSIQVAKPGFINFSFVEQALTDYITVILTENERYGHAVKKKKQRVMIEFVSANPTGPLTIAHGRQAAVGDTLARILSVTGREVHKEFYVNDAGRQIRLLGLSILARLDHLRGIEGRIPDEGYQGEYIIDVAKAFQTKMGNSIEKLTREELLAEVTKFGVAFMLRWIQHDLSDLRVVFDEYFLESSLYEQNMIEKALEKLQSKELLYEAEEALWFKSTFYGDDKDRVLRKKTGEFTYLAPDIAYHASKFSRGFGMLVNLWGPDHHGYVPRIKAACEALGFSSDDVKILLVQLTTLFRNGQPVRMSTRAGEFITLRELMDEVGSDATRFFFLMRKIDSHLDFDLELAKKKSDDNPVFYLQYAHARICSILSYAGVAEAETEKLSKSPEAHLLTAPEELDLIKKMVEFSEVLEQAASNLEPYRVVDYLRELAALFHKFYTVHRVVTEDAALTRARIMLICSVRIILRNGLNVLGVTAPVSM